MKIQFAILVIIFRFFKYEKLKENLARWKEGLLSWETKMRISKLNQFPFFPIRLHFGTETLRQEVRVAHSSKQWRESWCLVFKEKSWGVSDKWGSGSRTPLGSEEGHHDVLCGLPVLGVRNQILIAQVPEASTKIILNSP